MWPYKVRRLAFVAVKSNQVYRVIASATMLTCQID